MRSITVEPERLETVASDIEEANQEYDRTYQAIYDQVDKMSASWTGKDNVAFTNQIKTFEDDLRQISIIMRQYADFLHNSARAYRETQDEIYAGANRLRT
ncbi:MAG: WXG100 family type VII secretion target [Erysipelotrichaceae bacterium]|nr:WXG100 family type VII secretion target [Erysipelotrichaceae bacterium]